MAKRFIETGIFRKPLVRGLKAPYKSFFIYFITECDHAGVWDTTNLDIDSILLGEELTIEGIKKAFEGELIFIGSKVFMPGFVKYQYGSELNPDNRVHKSVIARLDSIGIDSESLAPYKPLPNPSQGGKDTDKDKPKDKPKDKDRPNLEEFIDYVVSKMPDINPEWTKGRATRAAQSRYETYVDAGWKDGNGKPIKNWKTKAKNAITHEKPWSYGDDTTNPPKTNSIVTTTPDGTTKIGGREFKMITGDDLQEMEAIPEDDPVMF